MWLTKSHRHPSLARVIPGCQRIIPPRSPTPSLGIRHLRMQELPPQAKLYRNTRVWSMYVDLVEALGTFEEARAVYDEMLSLRVATPQIVLNFADFLATHKFWEDAFQVYEKGVALFKYPHVEPIWLGYLKAFVDRHKGNKLERARDLFRQVRRLPASHRLPPSGAPGSRHCGGRRCQLSEPHLVAPARADAATPLTSGEVTFTRAEANLREHRRHARTHRRTSARRSTSCGPHSRSSTASRVAASTSSKRRDAPCRETSAPMLCGSLRARRRR